MMNPTATATCHESPSHNANSATTAVVPSTCAPPRPTMGTRIFQSTAGRNSKPMTKSIMTTPNSAMCMTSPSSEPTRLRQNGPITMPARR